LDVPETYIPTPIKTKSFKFVPVLKTSTVDSRAGQPEIDGLRDRINALDLDLGN
jgi:hypothetical protein